jgi:hypothetical protein
MAEIQFVECPNCGKMSQTTFPEGEPGMGTVTVCANADCGISTPGESSNDQMRQAMDAYYEQ